MCVVSRLRFLRTRRIQLHAEGTQRAHGSCCTIIDTPVDPLGSMQLDLKMTSNQQDINSVQQSTQTPKSRDQLIAETRDTEDLEAEVYGYDEEELNRKVVEYCCKGRADRVGIFLRRGVDVGWSDFRAWTMLMYATRNGQQECVELLIRSGSDVDAFDTTRKTSLMLACEYGHTACAELLVGHGADINMRDKYDKNALEYACERGQKGCLDLLLSRCDVHERGDFHRTALMFACINGNVMCAAKLLLQGSDVNARDIYGNTSLMLAGENGHDSTVDFLVNHNADVDAKNKDKQTALMLTCRNGHERCVELLLRHGSNINAHDKFSNTALMMACDRGHENTAKLLLKHKVNVNAKNSQRQTALMLMCQTGLSEVAEILLQQQGVDCNERDKIQATALTHACYHGHAICVKLLLRHGSDVNARDAYQTTPLMCACDCGNSDIVSLLLQRKANAQTRNAHNETAMMWAGRNGHAHIIDLLLQHQLLINRRVEFHKIDLEKTLLLSVRGGSENVVEILLQNGANPNAIDEQGTPALIVGAKGSSDKIVELLLKQDADTEICDANGKNAFSYSIENQNSWIFKILLPSSLDSNSLRQIAMAFVGHDNSGHLAVLLNTGFDLDWTKGKDTVFSCAMRRPRADCLELLLKSGTVLDEGSNLKRVHRDAMTHYEHNTRKALFATIEFGIFEWHWCPGKLYESVLMTAFRAGACPGASTDSCGNRISPILWAYVNSKSDMTELFLKYCYYFTEDYCHLIENPVVSQCAQAATRLSDLTHQPLTLVTWSFLTISKCLSLSGPPFRRARRVDALPVPDSVKRCLRFEVDLDKL